MNKGVEIKPAEGKLGVMLPGLGAVSTTFIAGVHAIRKGLRKPIGSLTQMGTIRLGKRTENRVPKIKDFVPLTSLEDLEFCAWDIFPDDAYQSAITAGVLDRQLIDQLKPELEAVKPIPAVFEQKWVKNLHGTNVKKAKTHWDYAQMLIEDIQKFKETSKAARLVMVWCASTEVYEAPCEIHEGLDRFEKALKDNDPRIPPSQVYAYACIAAGVPYCNGAPNVSVDFPAMIEFAKDKKVPVSGKDYKSGQTFMKTLLAPGIKTRLLGVKGWFSTNILGNRDGEVLDDPAAFKSKEISKTTVLDYIFQRDIYPELYGDYYHKVRINYYPPRGDSKESWDNIDIFGWMEMPMAIKVNFLCRDSILAAPLALDIALFSDLAARAGMHGIQEWLSFYYKTPMTAPGLYPEHDIFIQLMKLKNTLRYLRGEDLITHLGLEYYD